MITVFNPDSGWIQNTNNTPFNAAGPGNSPQPEDYPAYMANNPENRAAFTPCEFSRARTTLRSIR